MSTGRREREVFFVAGYQLLGDRGFEALTVAALCNRVGSTKGSFYHHFENLAEFVGALATRWQAWHSRIFSHVDNEPDLRQRFAMAANVSFPIMGPGSVAMRAWAATNPTVATGIQLPHDAAMAMCSRAFAAYAEDSDAGMLLAAMYGALTVGFQHRLQPLERDRWMAIIAEAYRSNGIGSDLIRVGKRTQLSIETLGPPPRAVTTAGAFAIAPPVEQTWPSRQETPAAPKERYFRAAWDLLAEQGPGALTSRALAERVGLSRGSFSHHFSSTEQFQRELARGWAQGRADEIARRAGERNRWRRLESLLSDVLTRPVQAEVAWRAWGHANPTVGTAVRDVDRRYERALAEALADVSTDPKIDLLAEMTAAFVLGLHRWYPPFELDLAARAAVEWCRRVLGIGAEIDVRSGRLELSLVPS